MWLLEIRGVHDRHRIIEFFESRNPAHLNRLPSRATPYLAPAAGAIISATTLARTREA
jgi:hypothetical protein